MSQPAPALNDALRVISSRILQKNAALACLLCAKASPYPGGTEWTVTNLDAYASVRIPGPEIGPCLIPVNWLRALLVGETVDIQVTGGKNPKLTIESGGLKATTALLTDAFPETPEIREVTHTITTDADRWRALWPLLSEGEGRDVLEHFIAEQGDVWATNGRLAIRLIGEAGEYAGFIPGKFPWGLTGEVKIETTKSHVRVTTGNITIISSLFNGTPPRVRQVSDELFQKWSGVADINRSDFAASLAPFAKFQSVVIDSENGVVTANGENGATLENKLPFDAGNQPQVRVNPNLLRPLLLGLSGETVEIKVSGNGTFILVRGDKSDAILMGLRQ